MMKVPYYPVVAVLSRCEPAFCRTLWTTANLPNELCCFSNKVAEPCCGHRLDSPQSPRLILPQLLNFLAITKSSCFNNALLFSSLIWMQGHWRGYYVEWLARGSVTNPRIMQVVTLSTCLLSAVSSHDCHVNAIIHILTLEKQRLGDLQQAMLHIHKAISFYINTNTSSVTYNLLLHLAAKTHPKLRTWINTHALNIYMPWILCRVSNTIDYLLETGLHTMNRKHMPLVFCYHSKVHHLGLHKYFYIKICFLFWIHNI